MHGESPTPPSAKLCTSEPQIPTAVTRTCTSPGAGSGGGGASIRRKAWRWWSSASCIGREAYLFFEKVVEGGARVVRASWHRRRGNRHSVVVCRRRIPGDGHTRLEKPTLIRLILARDASSDRLEALEPGGRFEMRALLATMKRCGALRTVALPFNVFG